MSTDVHYHTQPHTLDPAQEPPENTENVPLAQGHDEEDAADVRDAQAEHRDQVRSEQEARDDATEAGEPEPGAPRAPGDHAGSDDDTTDDTSTEGTTETTQSAQEDSDCPPSGTIEEVKAWVGDDPDRAQQALDAEREGANRQTLVSYLEDKGAS
jgi:hypothetical protein